MVLQKFIHTFARAAAITALVVLAAGCKYRYIEKPERLLSESEMADVICELTYIDMLQERGAFQRDSTLARIGRHTFIESVYKKYGINKKILRQNNEYYSEHNRRYIAIYAEAMNRLKTKADQYERKQEEKLEKRPESQDAKKIDPWSVGLEAAPQQN